METIRISQLSEADSLDDLYTIGIDGDNRSVKVSLDYIKTQVDIVNEADAAAVFANIAADKALDATADALEAKDEVLEVVNAANEVVTKTMAVPTIDIRLIRNRSPHRSIHFPNETDLNIVDRLQYRINGLPEQINAFRLEGWQINLLRPRWIHGSRGLHYKKWATCEAGRSKMGPWSYPTLANWKYSTCHNGAGTLWCGDNVNNLGRIDIPEGYKGEWLDFGSDFLEKLIRRYVYIQQLYFSHDLMEFVPLSCFRADYIPPEKDLTEISGAIVPHDYPHYSPGAEHGEGGGSGGSGGSGSYGYTPRPDGSQPYITIDDSVIIPRDEDPDLPSTPDITRKRIPDVVFIRIAGHRRRQCIYGKYKKPDGTISFSQNLLEATGQAKYISLPFALALSKNIDGKHNVDTTGEDTHYEKRIDGQRTYFTAIFRKTDNETPNSKIFQYTAKISGLGSPKTNTKAKE